VAEDQTGESTPEQTDLAPSKRTRVRRLAERGHYDRETVHAILDEGFVCHVGTLDSTGSGPVVIPTAYCRVNDLLYLHGAPANAGLRQASSGTPICVTVTLVDGLVLARSAFHHSINYRSVVIYANATEVTDPEEKGAAMAALVEHIVPGRGADARESTAAELRAIRVVRVPLDEASAKIRTGGPKDDPEDLPLPIWAGEVPFRTTVGTPITAPGKPESLEVPSYVVGYARPVRSA
jgi:nitroimidazol reductase NimA-like FMN-containing flavoprotein (pyridoxamine 5'-phosphate oxidase superfamily)